MAVGTGTAILGSAAIGALANKGGGGTTQSTQNAAPWSGQEPFLAQLYSRANTRYNEGPYNYAQAPQTVQALGMQQNRAISGSPLNQAAQDQNLATLRGDYLDLSKNPGVKSAMDMARTGINAQFSGDNFGNSAHQEWLSKGLLNAAAPFYESERQRQMGASALAPTLANQDYFDINQLGAVGAAQEANQQAQFNAPWENLQRFQNAINGQPGGTTTAQNPYFTNPLANALGMGLGGLALYNGLNQGGLLGPGQVPEMVAGQYSLVNPQYG